MVDSKMLARIMGAEDSPTSRLLRLRRTPEEGELETGVWYSNFTRVREEAERRGVPFFAMWTNGELCAYCRRFTSNVLEEEFLKRMKASGGLWWLGGSMDDNDEDKRGGKGFSWCMHGGEVNNFPFFAVRLVRDGKPVSEFFGSGSDYDLEKPAPEGAMFVVRRIAQALGDRSAAERHEAGVPHRVELSTALHIRFNPAWDVQHIARFQNALRENGGHCVCSAAKTPDSMCMCKEFLEQQTTGFCRCGAFEKYDVRGM